MPWRANPPGVARVGSSRPSPATIHSRSPKKIPDTRIDLNLLSDNALNAFSRDSRYAGYSVLPPSGESPCRRHVCCTGREADLGPARGEGSGGSGVNCGSGCPFWSALIAMDSRPSPARPRPSRRRQRAPTPLPFIERKGTRCGNPPSGKSRRTPHHPRTFQSDEPK